MFFVLFCWYLNEIYGGILVVFGFLFVSLSIGYFCVLEVLHVGF